MLSKLVITCRSRQLGASPTSYDFLLQEFSISPSELLAYHLSVFRYIYHPFQSTDPSIYLYVCLI